MKVAIKRAATALRDLQRIQATMPEHEQWRMGAAIRAAHIALKVEIEADLG